jgi:hypothetical protein
MNNFTYKFEDSKRSPRLRGALVHGTRRTPHLHGPACMMLVGKMLN